MIYFSRFAYAFIAGRTRRIELLRGLADKRSARGLIVISFGLVQDRSWEHARFTIAKVASTLTRGNPVLRPRDRLWGRVFIHYFLDGEADQEALDAGFEVLNKRIRGHCSVRCTTMR